MKVSSAAQLCAFALSGALSAVPCAASASPEGLWLHVADDGEPRAVIRLSVSNGELTGVIVDPMPGPDAPPEPVCEACEGALRGAPLKGLPIITGVSESGGGVWQGGTILDATTGDTYKVRLTLDADGSTLSVRGYVGAPLFGRTLTWQRLE